MTWTECHSVSRIFNISVEHVDNRPVLRLYPDLLSAVGLRGGLSHLAPESGAGVAAVLQSRASPDRARLPDPGSAIGGAPVNNVFTNYI
jgi:hypothetical protein